MNIKYNIDNSNKATIKIFNIKYLFIENVCRFKRNKICEW